MPLSRGIEVYGEVRRWSPDTRVAVVTGFSSVRSLADWVAAGVDGVFLKSCPPDEMAQGFRLILGGETYISREVLARLDGQDEAAELSLRERQVLHLIAEGCSNVAIAERLGISAKTVDNHRTRLMAKLGVHSVAQLLAYALKEGLLDQSTQL
jgi:DNA-binding NarL/FixJ family response regulator